MNKLHNILQETIIKKLTEEYFKLDEKIKNSSPEEILSLGINFLENFSHANAKVAFDELAKVDKFREISKLYSRAIFSLIDSRGIEETQKKTYKDKAIIKNSIANMIESTRMYAEGEISKEDLFMIERLVDRIPFDTMTISGRDEFERIYYKFKEYNLKLFLEDK